MTNGEKMLNTFHGKVARCDETVFFTTGGWHHAYDAEWWNAEYKEPTKNDSEIDIAIKIIKADDLAPYSVEDILMARDLAVEALKQMRTAKNSLSVEEITAITEWTAKLTQASEEAYRRGYLDCSEKLRSFQKLHDEERELKDKLNKIDIEDAWKCGFEQGVKHEKLGRTDICPHCGEYIGEEE